tara:strand:- start:401 stop:544 length:144 start_codon:yes stop_codon:yes gene_type:complete
MSELNTQAQIIELTDEELELVEGGGTAKDILKVAKIVVLPWPINQVL